jgi:formate hydrogenlyase subunit 6/NADH:ubiquinone oxidoreductase subunit I
MRYPKLRELREAIKALVKRPYTSKYPLKAHQPFERFRGRPYFHQDDCLGCAACAQVCPTGALQYQDELVNKRAVRKLVVHWDVCIFCGNCQANCPTGKGIVLSQEFDFATTQDRLELKQQIEKELVCCSACRETIVPYDQYVWVADKLGSLLFSNASLMLFYSRFLGLASLPEPSPQDAELLRRDRLRILCPRCRREAVLKS